MRSSAAVARGVSALGSAAEARILLCHVLGVEPSGLPLVAEISDADAAAYADLLRRRAAGEPVQHITGRAHFRTVELAVGPGVFVPRPETELLVGWALERLAPFFAGASPVRSAPVVVELCAGSGAISKALASERRGLDQHAVELSATAWPFLVANLAGTGVRPVLADIADAIPELDGTVDMVIANPPYLPESAREALPVDVLADPGAALFGGADGLDAVRTVARVAQRLLKPGGRVCCEHEDGQGEAAPEVFRRAGFVAVVDHDDLAGRPRFVTAQAPVSVPGRIAP